MKYAQLVLLTTRLFLSVAYGGPRSLLRWRPTPKSRACGKEREVNVHAVRLSVLLILSPYVMAAYAQGSVYRCEQDDGSIVFSDLPCAEESDIHRIQQAYKSDSIAPRRRMPISTSPSAVTRSSRGDRQEHETMHEPISYRCSVTTGEVWYRHQPCPSSLRVRESATVTGTATNTGNPVIGSTTFSQDIPVTQEAVSRSMACSEIYRAGLNRRGSDRDQRYSTYHRNQGLDPCQ